jgi:sugar/nucleoside kinase (ribokinase family)
MAAILKIINHREADQTTKFELMEKAAGFATACSAIVASRHGADTVPSVEEIKAFMR